MQHSDTFKQNRYTIIRNINKLDQIARRLCLPSILNNLIFMGYFFLLPDPTGSTTLRRLGNFIIMLRSSVS